jgi:cytochrome c
MISCGDKKNTNQAETTTQVPETIQTAEEKPTSPLLAKYDCKSCHKLDVKFQGPSYTEIAEKYSGQTGAVKYLSEKIIAGGTGVWGSVPMNAHVNMPVDTAKLIAKYILELKK